MLRVINFFLMISKEKNKLKDNKKINFCIKFMDIVLNNN